MKAHGHKYVNMCIAIILSLEPATSSNDVFSPAPAAPSSKRQTRSTTKNNSKKTISHVTIMSEIAAAGYNDLESK